MWKGVLSTVALSDRKEEEKEGGWRRGQVCITDPSIMREKEAISRSLC